MDERKSKPRGKKGGNNSLPKSVERTNLSRNENDLIEEGREMKISINKIDDENQFSTQS